MWKILLATFGFLRIVIPPFIFYNPVITTIVMIPILDNLDGYIASQAKLTRRKYNLYDKLLDYWWYLFILFYMRTTPLFGIFLVLFGFRSIAQWISIVTGNEKVFIFFPAVIETYFIGYVISLIFPSLSFLFIGWNQIVPLSIALVASLIREYIIHVRRISVAKLIIGFGPEWKK